MTVTASRDVTTAVSKAAVARQGSMVRCRDPRHTLLGDTKGIPALGRRRWWAEPVVRCVWVGCAWVSYVDNANFRRFWTDFYWAASFLLRSVHCSNYDSGLFSVAVAAHLYSSQSQYASRAPPVPTHPICLSSLSHMKEVSLPSHNPWYNQRRD